MQLIEAVLQTALKSISKSDGKLRKEMLIFSMKKLFSARLI